MDPTAEGPKSTGNRAECEGPGSYSKERQCRKQPQFKPLNSLQPLTGGLGHNGLAKFNPTWLNQGQVSKGRGLTPSAIRFADRNGDGA